MTMLQTIDPVRGEQRKRRKLKRRIYHSKVSRLSFVYVNILLVMLCRDQTIFGIVTVTIRLNHLELQFMDA